MNSANKGLFSILLFEDIPSSLFELFGKILSIFSIKITLGDNNLLNKKIDLINEVLLSGD